MSYIPGIKALLAPFAFATYDNTAASITSITRTDAKMYIRLIGAFDYSFLALPATPVDGDEITIRFDGDGTAFRTAVLAVPTASGFTFDDAVLNTISSALEYVMQLSEVVHLKFVAAASRWMRVSSSRPRRPEQQLVTRDAVTISTDVLNSYVAEADVIQFVNSSFTLNGIQIPISGANTRRVVFVVPDSQTFTINHLSTSAATAERIHLGGLGSSTAVNRATFIYLPLRQVWMLESYTT